MTPAVVIFAILLPLLSVNQRLLSDPNTMQQAPLSTVGIRNSVIVPVVLIFAILLEYCSTNHRLPSETGPLTMPSGKLEGVVGMVNSVTACAPAAAGQPSAKPAATAQTRRTDRHHAV